MVLAAFVENRHRASSGSLSFTLQFPFPFLFLFILLSATSRLPKHAFSYNCRPLNARTETPALLRDQAPSRDSTAEQPQQPAWWRATDLAGSFVWL